MKDFYSQSNRFRNPTLGKREILAGRFSPRAVRAFHRSVPGYNRTALLELPTLGKELGLGCLFIKDESSRFSLSSFKPLGASWAISGLIARGLGQSVESPPGFGKIREMLHSNSERLPIFATASDGNHGRGVAWVAKLLDCEANIFLPAGTARARIESIRREGAEVIIVNGGYDKAVAESRVVSEQNGWQLISDTSWEGYEAIPKSVIEGYSTIFDEVDEQLSERATQIDVVLIQSGVGALAASAAHYYSLRTSNNDPILINVEAIGADCLLASAASEDGTIQSTAPNAKTIMAGLNCETPSMIAWPTIRDRFDHFVAIDDRYARRAMLRYYRPNGDDPQIISGESGAASLGALIAATRDENRAQFDTITLGKRSPNVLLINTEGATDPDSFDRIIAGG